MKNELIITGDGSHTIFIRELKEHYHSVHGAIAESQYVFIKNGLLCFPDESQISICEVGFGTGLNAFLTGLKRASRNILYTSLEPHPVPFDLINQLNYTQQLGHTGLFRKIHEIAWNDLTEIEPGFSLQKLQQSFQHFKPHHQYDLIYFDAFASHAQPELWEQSIFLKTFELLKTNGILVTYCAKGSVKRALKNAGFKVEALPGPPGKREMTRARMTEDSKSEVAG